MKKRSPYSILTLAQKEDRLKRICEGLSSEKNYNQIAKEMGLDRRTIGGWVVDNARFLVLKKATIPERVAELKRRADIFLQTGMRVETWEEKPSRNPIGAKTCTRVIRREIGKTVLCGKETTRRTCVACEAALNYRHLPDHEAVRVVEIARGAQV